MPTSSIDSSVVAGSVDQRSSYVVTGEPPVNAGGSRTPTTIVVELSAITTGGGAALGTELPGLSSVTPLSSLQPSMLHAVTVNASGTPGCTASPPATAT